MARRSRLRRIRDEEAAGSNPATPTRKWQVTGHLMPFPSRYASPDVRFGSQTGADAGCSGPRQPIACRADGRPNLPLAGRGALASPPSGLVAQLSTLPALPGWADMPVYPRIPGPSCPSRSDLSTSAIWSWSIQVLCPCRRPCGVRPVLTGNQEATTRSSPVLFRSRSTDSCPPCEPRPCCPGGTGTPPTDRAAARTRVADESRNAAPGWRNERLTGFAAGRAGAACRDIGHWSRSGLASPTGAPGPDTDHRGTGCPSSSSPAIGMGTWPSSPTIPAAPPSVLTCHRPSSSRICVL